MITGVSVVIPVGPGHERYQDAVVGSAHDTRRPTGCDVEVVVVPDKDGRLGRSSARNLGARHASHEWLFFIDADDLMDPGAIEALIEATGARPDILALWGECWSQRGYPTNFQEERPPHDRPISHWRELQEHGPYVGFCTGFFVHKKAFEAVGGWYEPWDYTEDFEIIYALVHSVPFLKVGGRRLLLIRRWLARAGGERGYRCDMTKESPMMVDHDRVMRSVHEFWRQRGPIPYSEAELAAKRAGTLWSHKSLTGAERGGSLHSAARSPGSLPTAG